MYYDLLTVSFNALKSIADAYNRSGCERGTGVYFVVVNHTTREFFKTLKPESSVESLHEAFLTWLQSAGLAMSEELEMGQPVNSELARSFLRASERFAAALEATR